MHGETTITPRQILKTFLNNINMRCFDMYFGEDAYLEESSYIGPTFITR